MSVVIIRLIIIYLFTVITMRLLGKRQIGQLEMSELVTAFFLSELAVYPITDNNIPITFGIIPALALIAIEVIISFLTVKIPFFKKLFDSFPSILISKGKIVQGELIKNRITLEELLSQLRLNGTPDLNEVYYAILEPNGQISITAKTEYRGLSPVDIEQCPTERGIVHAIIKDGKIIPKELTFINRDEAWLTKKLSDNEISSVKDVFLMTVDDSYCTNIILKERSV